MKHISKLLLISLFFLRLPALGSNLDLPCEEEGYVYHASPIQGLTVLKPHKSTHGKSWVYATRHPELAALFIAPTNDFDVFIGLWSGDAVLAERYKNAFAPFRNLKGSIYKISNEGFLRGQTSWKAEVVNSKEVKVVSEHKVTDTFKSLKLYEKQKKLKLYYYPNRPKGAPAGDGDLVEKAVLWIKEGLPGTEEELLSKHPHLKDDLEKALKASNK